MKKIILITFLSFFISSVSYSKINASYKLKCKVFDYGNFDVDEGKDYFFYFNIDFISSIFLMDMVIGNKNPNVKVILTLEKDKSKINEPNINPFVWFTEKEDRGQSYLISFSNEKISLTNMQLVMSETNKVVGVKRAKSLCDEVN